MASDYTNRPARLKASNKYVRYKKVIQSLAQSEIEMYREVFNFFDKSKKGFIIAADFERALTSICRQSGDGEAEDLLKEHDINGDGKVTFEEMVVTTVKRLQHTDSGEQMKKLFKRFDENSDGLIDRAELVELLNSLGDKFSTSDIDEIMADVDENHDGFLQFEEFMKIMNLQ